MKKTLKKCEVVSFGSKALSGEQNIISGFKVLTESPKAFSLLEFEMDTPNMAESLNVYKKDQVEITLKMVSPTDKTIVADAFYYEEYVFCKNTKLNNRTNKKPTFRFRISAFEEGWWFFEVAIKINTEIKDTLYAGIYIDKNKKGSQLLKVEPINRQVFAKASGEAVIMIGENLGEKTYVESDEDFSDAVICNMRKLAKNGANHVRICDCSLNSSRIKKSVHTMCQASSAMWDRIFREAEVLGIYITFVMMLPNEANANPDFEKSIWHENSGGYITSPEDFFTNEDCIQAFETYVRYIISRWGYSENLFAWELFSDIDCTTAVAKGNISQVRSWLDIMTDYINQQDPYGHIKSISVFFPSILPALSGGFELLCYHQCNYYGVGHIAEMQRDAHRTYNCPVLVGETGLGGAVANISVYPLGKDLCALHLANWAGVMGGGCGTAMYIDWKALEKEDAFFEYRALADMAKRIPWNDPNIKLVNTNTLGLSNNRSSVWGYLGTDYAYLWVYDNCWLPITRGKSSCYRNDTLKLEMCDGIYEVCFFDTRTSSIVKKENVLSKNGELLLEMPEWSKDIAISVVKPHC